MTSKKHTCGFPGGRLACAACNDGEAFEKENVTFYKENATFYKENAAFYDVRTGYDPKEFGRTSSEKDLDLLRYWANLGFHKDLKILDYPHLMDSPAREESLNTLFSAWESIAREKPLSVAVVSPPPARILMNLVPCPCGCGCQISETQARSIRNFSAQFQESERLRKLLAEERHRADRAEDELAALKRELRNR